MAPAQGLFTLFSLRSFFLCHRLSRFLFRLFLLVLTFAHDVAPLGLEYRCLLITFSARPTAEPAPVAAESALPCPPILTALNAAIGMSQVRSADPPEEGHRPKAGEQGDPETDTFEMMLR